MLISIQDKAWLIYTKLNEVEIPYLGKSQLLHMLLLGGVQTIMS
jgi:hypothetical protein